MNSVGFGMSLYKLATKQKAFFAILIMMVGMLFSHSNFYTAYNLLDMLLRFPYFSSTPLSKAIDKNRSLSPPNERPVQHPAEGTAADTVHPMFSRLASQALAINL